MKTRIGIFKISIYKTSAQLEQLNRITRDLDDLADEISLIEGLIYRTTVDAQAAMNNAKSQATSIIVSQTKLETRDKEIAIAELTLEIMNDYRNRLAYKTAKEFNELITN